MKDRSPLFPENLLSPSLAPEYRRNDKKRKSNPKGCLNPSRASDNDSSAEGQTGRLGETEIQAELRRRDQEIWVERDEETTQDRRQHSRQQGGHKMPAESGCRPQNEGSGRGCRRREEKLHNRETRSGDRWTTAPLPFPASPGLPISWAN